MNKWTCDTCHKGDPCVLTLTSHEIVPDVCPFSLDIPEWVEADKIK